MTLQQYIKDAYYSIKKLLNVFFVFSAAIMSFIMTLNYSVFIEYNGTTGISYNVQPFFAVAAAIITLPLYLYLIIKKNFVESLEFDKSPCIFFVSGAEAVLLMYQMLQDTFKNMSSIMLSIHLDSNLYQNFCYNVLTLLCIVSVLALFIFSFYVNKLLFCFIKEYCQKADIYEKIFFGVGISICLSLICVFYTKSNALWSSLDLVYQTDSMLVYDHYYPVFTYGYDFDWDIGIGGIRHPLATFLLYPINLIVVFLSNMLFWIPNIRPILFALFQSIMLIITVITLKRIVKSNWVYFIFTASFPFLFFTIFIEKYQIAVLLIVMFVYVKLTDDRKELHDYFLIAASGMMITSAIYGLFCGNINKLKEKIIEYFRIFFLFILTLIGTGRINYLINFRYLLNQNSVMFYKDLHTKISYAERFNGFTNLIASSFIPVQYEVMGEQGNQLYWPHLIDKINILGLLVFLFIIVTIFCMRKEKNVQLLSLWFIFAFVQFIITGFGSNCEPLFSLYFSWAIVALLIIGINHFVKKPILQVVLYGSLLCGMCYTNFTHITFLLQFLIEKAPL